MRERFAQNVKFVNALPDALALNDLFNGGQTTDVVNLSNFERATWVIQKGSGNTGTALISVESCDDTTPSTATAIPFDYWAVTSGDTVGDKATAVSTGFTTTAGANQLYIVEVNSAELSGTNKYVRLKAVEVANDPVGGSITCTLSGPKYMDGDNTPSAIV